MPVPPVRLLRRFTPRNDTNPLNSTSWQSYNSEVILLTEFANRTRSIRGLAMREPCYRHPEVEGKFYCQKDGNYMCQECSCCHTPRVYCRFRTACTIDLLTKEGELTPCEGQETREAG